MDEFNLTEYVNARCGEVYLSRKGTLLFLCSLCNESLKGYGMYLEHIITEHDLPVYSVEEVGANTCLDDEFDADAQAMEAIEMLDDEKIFPKFGEELYELSKVDTEFNMDTKFSIESLENNYQNHHDYIYADNDQEFFQETDMPIIKEEQLSSTDENTSAISNDDTKCPKSKDRYEYPSQGFFECPVCKLCIKGKSNLDKHVLRHDDDNKRFQCAYCPKRFHVKFELRQHESSHTGDRPYLCTICGRRFVSTGKLNEHTNMTHENIRNKTCEICNKSFYSNKYLRRHMLTHSDERSHKCQECGASFKIRKTLTAHMKLHLNKREYQCKLCDAQFNQRPALHSHMKTRHKAILSTAVM